MAEERLLNRISGATGPWSLSTRMHKGTAAITLTPAIRQADAVTYKSNILPEGLPEPSDWHLGRSSSLFRP